MIVDTHAHFIIPGFVKSKFIRLRRIPRVCPWVNAKKLG